MARPGLYSRVVCRVMDSGGAVAKRPTMAQQATCYECKGEIQFRTNEYGAVLERCACNWTWHRRIPTEFLPPDKPRKPRKSHANTTPHRGSMGLFKKGGRYGPGIQVGSRQAATSLVDGVLAPYFGTKR